MKNSSSAARTATAVSVTNNASSTGVASIATQEQQWGQTPMLKQQQRQNIYMATEQMLPHGADTRF